MHGFNVYDNHIYFLDLLNLLSPSKYLEFSRKIFGDWSDMYIIEDQKLYECANEIGRVKMEGKTSEISNFFSITSYNILANLYTDHLYFPYCDKK